MTQSKFNLVDFIIDFESGDITEFDEICAGFQYILNTGALSGLQGFYHRMTAQLLREGAIKYPSTKKFI